MSKPESNLCSFHESPLTNSDFCNSFVLTATSNTACNLAHVAVIIPVYNEAASLPLVLQDLPLVGRLIVVDNASNDESANVAKKLGAEVISENRRGYGSACLAGIAHLNSLIQAKEYQPEIVVFLDGDFSDYPQDLITLLEPIQLHKADFVLGSRIKGDRESGAMPPQSIYGNKLACFLIWLFWGAKYTDLGPFRAITWVGLQSLNMQDTNYGWTVEMQIKAHLKGLRMMEVPVRYRRRIGISKISGTISGTIKAGYKILYTIARYRWLTLGN